MAIFFSFFSVGGWGEGDIVVTESGRSKYSKEIIRLSLIVPPASSPASYQLPLPQNNSRGGNPQSTTGCQGITMRFNTRQDNSRVKGIDAS